MRNKNLIIIGGNEEASIGLKKLKNKYFITLIDGNENCIGRKFADYFIKANVYNYKEILTAVKKEKNLKKPDAILTLSSDDLLSVAHLNSHFNTEGISIDSAIICNNKYLMKEKLFENKILTPNFILIKSKKDIDNKIQSLICKKYILKPIFGRGALGVYKANNKNDLMERYIESKKITGISNYLIEENILGDQISSEAIILNGNVKFCALADRNYDIEKFTYPFIIENGGDTPSKYTKEIFNKVLKITEKISKIFNLPNGTIKLDLVYNQKKIYVIELALRLSGGNFSSITIPKVYGIEIIKILVKILCKEDNLIIPKFKIHNYVSNRYLVLKSGRLKKFKYPNKKLTGCIYNDIKLKKNQMISKLTRHADRIGSVIYSSKNKDLARKRAVKHIHLIKKNCVIDGPV